MIVDHSIYLRRMSNEEKQTRRGLQVFKENPFVQEAIENQKGGVKRIIGKTQDRMMVVSGDTGEVIAPAGFWQYQEVDKTQFVKLYINGVKAIADLSPAGTKVFALLYTEMQKNVGKDKVYLSFSAMDKDEAGMSQATFTRGMKELIEKNFVAPTLSVGWYFINPDYMWNGDRLAFVKEYRLKKQNTDADFRVELEKRGQLRIDIDE